MTRIAAFLLASLLAAASPAAAQIVGQAPANSVYGNPSGSVALPAWMALPSCSGGALAYNTTTHLFSCVALGSAAVASTGTSGHAVPFLDGSNTWTATQNFTGAFQAGGNTMTFPASAGTLAALNIPDQTVSGGANVTSQSLTTGNITVDCGSRPLQAITNGGAFTITAPSNDGSCQIKVTNNGTAGTITFAGFSVGSNTGDTLDTTNGHKFIVQVTRIAGDSTYGIKALQ